MNDGMNIEVAKARGWTNILAAPGFACSNQDQFPIGTDPEGNGCISLPKYTTSPADALTLIDSLETEGWTCELSNLYAPEWECWFNHREHNTKYARGTFCLAICTAFLATKGQRK